MAGVAGAVIGLPSGAQPPIGGLTRATTDGTTSARGCTTNFIGFGLALTSQEPDPNDFSVPDDTVVVSKAVAASYTPGYTPVAGTNPARSTLAWTVVP